MQSSNLQQDSFGCFVEKFFFGILSDLKMKQSFPFQKRLSLKFSFFLPLIFSCFICCSMTSLFSSLILDFPPKKKRTIITATNTRKTTLQQMVQFSKPVASIQKRMPIITPRAPPMTPKTKREYMTTSHQSKGQYYCGMPSNLGLKPPMGRVQVYSPVMTDLQEEPSLSSWNTDYVIIICSLFINGNIQIIAFKEMRKIREKLRDLWGLRKGQGLLWCPLSKDMISRNASKNNYFCVMVNIAIIAF